ncbi:MAG: type II toxin-antitoxin system Phd/YefM family antitoxin [Desulfobacterales bacterium]|jgi:prevent-host-death family protein|nr:type II toxin-antitoxin system Phd/YefM family antitoxin [Desulfobacterales bacterium]
MKHIWQIQEAKNKLSEVVEEAAHRGPQVITRRGIEVAVVLSYADYRKITGAKKRLSSFFRESPLAGSKLDLDRSKDPLREDIDL